MKPKTLQAHFDGEHIRLDDPIELKVNTKLLVTILPEHTSDDEYEAWMLLSRKGLEDAYNDNEPDYSINLIKEQNPDYERR
ncbi:MAG: hypothetical protein IEMM0008_1211 [bacterium]|nr:MAG: hypothetical protein IEMM0008_1211 [bacterium]